MPTNQRGCIDSDVRHCLEIAFFAIDKAVIAHITANVTKRGDTNWFDELTLAERALMNQIRDNLAVLLTETK